MAVWLLVLAAIVPAVSFGQRKERKPEKSLRESRIVREYQCISCHTIGNEGGTVGPVLNQVGNRRSPEWIRRWLTDPNAVKAGTKMPNFEFTPGQLDELVGLLSALRIDIPREEILKSKDPLAGKGERLFEAYDCVACHRVGRTGRFIGPDLTWVGRRKSRAWESVWLEDPPAYKPGTFMPRFGLTKEEIEALTAYLHTLEGQENERSRRWEQTVVFYLDLKAPERGRLVFNRLACWACHGEKGEGGVRNDNQAPDGRTPAITAAVHDDREAVLRTVREGKPSARLDRGGPDPFDCPAYAEAVTDEELSDLVAFLETLAPKKRTWRFK